MISQKEYLEFLDAVDVVCLNCVEDTLNDDEVCNRCPVRKTCDYLHKTMNVVDL